MTKHAYYMTQRPFSIGAQPKEGFVEAEDFDGKKYIEDIDRRAWSRIVYDRERPSRKSSSTSWCPQSRSCTSGT